MLVERAFVRTLQPGGAHAVQVVLDRPRPLDDGKTCMFTAAVDFIETLRCKGCRGVAIQFYCMDKLHHAAFARRMRGRHALMYKDGFSNVTDDEPVPITLEMDDPTDERLLRLQGRLKTIAISNRQLKALWYEEMLIPSKSLDGVPTFLQRGGATGSGPACPESWGR